MLVFILTVAAVAAEDVSVSVGGTVELRGVGPAVLGAGIEVVWSWTMGDTGKVTPNFTMGCGGRCKLQEDGALRLDDARTNDSGVYRQEVYEGGTCRSRKEVTLTVYGHRRQGKGLHTGGEGPQVWSQGWTPLGLSLILFLLLIVIFIRRKRTPTATNQSGDTDPRCLEENLYVPMFRAKDPKTQNQTQDHTRTQTQNSPGTKSKSQSPCDSDPRCSEENLYAPIFRTKGPESQTQNQTQNQTQDQTQDHTRIQNSPGTKSKSQSPSDPGDPEEDIYV